ncbi:hypothetical protein THAOC_05245 [Thalassiosira oceanica]|uniref:Uncharacterized protein n=1 Tax=Thalassiosira oceanica TaxID=159749 RepID=K0T3B5_THAOC|nr:hypothetical protein THAOC_05245 [Thalassiosira oceanica]|eukprot:EJK73148.1 hypothetical protein THAOC_05245 [Thalassiosira oceanica]
MGLLLPVGLSMTRELNACAGGFLISRRLCQSVDRGHGFLTSSRANSPRTKIAPQARQAECITLIAGTPVQVQGSRIEHSDQVDLNRTLFRFALSLIFSQGRRSASWTASAFSNTAHTLVLHRPTSLATLMADASTTAAAANAAGDQPGDQILGAQLQRLAPGGASRIARGRRGGQQPRRGEKNAELETVEMNTNQMQVPSVFAIQLRCIECADEARHQHPTRADEFHRMIAEGASDDQLATTINSWGQADQGP